MKLPSLCQVLQEPLSIPVILENRTPFIAARGDMINRSRKLNPEQPRHASKTIPNATELSIKEASLSDFKLMSGPFAPILCSSGSV